LLLLGTEGERGMLRITVVENGKGPPLMRLEGRLAGAWVDEFRIAFERLRSRRAPARLDLGEVTYMDRAGVEAVLQAVASGAVVERRSPIVAEQLRG
jgi:anti-anti-sigma regulatory factor